MPPTIRTTGPGPLKRYLQSHVETPLAKFIIGGQVRDDQRVVIDATEEGDLRREVGATPCSHCNKIGRGRKRRRFPPLSFMNLKGPSAAFVMLMALFLTAVLRWSRMRLLLFHNPERAVVVCRDLQ